MSVSQEIWYMLAQNLGQAKVFTRWGRADERVSQGMGMMVKLRACKPCKNSEPTGWRQAVK